MRHANWLLGALVLTMGATACDTVEPGDYVVYRVASTSESLSDGCYWDYQGADANVRNDTSTIQSSSTFVLYAGVEKHRYLDTGELTLDGTYTGDFDEGEVYEFDGSAVDINWDNPDGAGSGAKRTTTVKTMVDLTVDGALAFGEVKIKTTYSCNGQGCGETPPGCTRTIEFVGTEVEDVTLHHDVPNGMGSDPTEPPDDDDIPGTGGAGGEGGAGGAGAGGEGGGGECTTCSAVLLEGAPTDQMCTESAYVYEDLMNCACYDCTEACGANMCSGTQMDSTCQSCVYEVCGEPLNACYADGGGA